MLFAQIPKNILKKISADLNINLGVIRVTLKEKQSEQTRFDKVKVVCNYLNNHLKVGDVDNPGSYFKGTVSMRWGSLSRDRDHLQRGRIGGNVLKPTPRAVSQIIQVAT